MTTLDVTQNQPAGSRERLSPPKDCTVSEADARHQLDRARVLTPHLRQAVRSTTELTLTFAPTADRAALAAFAETERGCCSFFDEITDTSTADGLMLHYAQPDGTRGAELAQIARMFDGSTQGADVDPAPRDSRKPSAGTVKRSAGLIAALGVACMACLIPGLAVGGAGIFAAGAIGADKAVMGVAALGLLGYAVITVRRRRRGASAANSASDGCGC